MARFVKGSSGKMKSAGEKSTEKVGAMNLPDYRILSIITILNSFSENSERTIIRLFEMRLAKNNFIETIIQLSFKKLVLL
jgi:hypothetical protein